MRRRVAFSRDTLQAHRLPPTEFMELNDRPALPPAVPTLLSLAVPLLTLGLMLGGVIVVLQHVMDSLRFQIEPALPLLVGACLSGYAAWQGYREPEERQAIARRLMWQLPLLVLVGLPVVRDARSAYVLLWGPAFALAALVALIVGKQFAFWTTAHPLVGWREVRTWQRCWSRIFRGDVPPECPEILTCRLALAILPLQFGIGFEVLSQLSSPGMRPEFQQNAGLLGLAAAVGPLPVLWLLWNTFGPTSRLPVGATLRATAEAFRVWLTYQHTDARYPGVFQFPDRWCRWAFLRTLLIVFPVALMGTALAFSGPEAGLFSGASLLASMAVTVGGAWPFPGVALVQFLVTFVILTGIPLLVMGTIVWFVIGGVLGRYWLALEVPGGSAQSRTKSAWSIAADRILNSADARERDHVLLGRALEGNYPVLLHKKLLHQHAHLLGDSGSRKTSLGIAPLIAQLIAARDCSVVVVDLKGDRALFETARLEAAQAGAEFRWFTTESDKSSHVFNPFEQSHLPRLTPNQKTQVVLTALSLDYGDAYGKGFFSAMNEIVLLTYLRHYDVHSFRELHQLLRDKGAYVAAGGNSKEWEKAQHLSVLADRLASIHPFNLTRADLSGRPEAAAAAIDVAQILSKPQVVYFHLQSPREPLGAPAIAKMVMYALFSAAADRLPHQKQRVYVIIDEFQQVVSENVQLVLEQARASNLAFVVAHQAQGQLDRKGVDIRDSVTSCTAVKQYFRISDEETREELMDLSGEAMYESLSWTQKLKRWMSVDDDDAFSPEDADGDMVDVEESIGPRLDRNMLMDISAAPRTSIVHFTEGSGFTQFGGYATPIISDFHISPDEYERRSTAAWPPASSETITVARTSAQDPPPQPDPGPRPPDPPPPPPPQPDPDDDWGQRLGQLGGSSKGRRDSASSPKEPLP